MEKLAALVLNGDGDQLAGHKAAKPEIQAFLDNVPAYMVTYKSKHLQQIIIELHALIVVKWNKKRAIYPNRVKYVECI